MWNKNIETFIGCNNEYSESKLVLFGAPFDGTTSYRPGTRFASKAIRSESFGIETYSPYQDKDLEDICVFDAGDLDIPFGNTERVLQEIESFTQTVLQDNKLPIMIGGEHLVTLGAVRAVAKQYPNLHIIHLDAHADLREDYLGETLSHATVLHRIWDLVGDNKIYQFGIRSGERAEFEFANEHTVMQKFNLDGFQKVIKKLKDVPVYFTLDLDVLDPSILPGTGTPEAGGISFTELIEAILQLSNLNIVGCDVNELSPVYDQSGVSTAVACKTVRELLLTLGGL
ncbi:agmatinase [Paludicola sp. MB14-C6]|uniref:agmatinase n=1 Tax=Paludihabitans sp. MB14-C6 TaxID=3070656 RepID=UPI0027DC0B7A|nr:agmatinase [Paludicola sp. MB14-C6]WMJ24397.1 agmatinase [Paludicola sp. MB14-C6]